MPSALNYYDTTDTGSKTIFDLENEIVNDINEYNVELLKYMKCTTIDKIKSGTITSENNIYNIITELSLNCISMPSVRDEKCKITDISNARRILPTNISTTSDYSILDRNNSSNLESKVNWVINDSNLSGNYSFEVSGNNVYVYKTSGTAINPLKYKIIDDFSCNQTTTDTEGEVATMANNISTKLDSMKHLLTDINSNSGIVKESNFNSILTNIKKKHSDILKLRNDLDIKMREIQNMGDNGHRFDQKIKMDATLYSSLAWTILATSLVYYVFVKME